MTAPPERHRTALTVCYRIVALALLGIVIGVLPGLVLKADVSYNTEDPFEDDDDVGVDTDPSTSGVLTMQLNY